MPAVLNNSTQRYAYVFIHEGRTYCETGFQTEREASRAESRKKSELTRALKINIRERDLQRIIAILYKAANTVDLVFPSLVPGLVEAYEFISGQKFRPYAVKWMNPDGDTPGVRREGTCR